MKNYKIVVSYDGSKYNGWQKQGNTSNTMQERFEKVLSRMCEHPVEIHASGRTDAGVHAISQTANFKCETKLSPCEIKAYLNKYLPEDILVKSCETINDRFHARLNAVSKTYEYVIATEKPDVFVRKYVWVAENKPDVNKMRKAAEKLIGTHDFKGFSTGKTKKSTIRTINWLEIAEKDGLITIRVNGSGFLYNMVRIISGTLYDIGTGALDMSIIDDVFESKIREKVGQTLPPQGLKLVEVFYN